MGHSLAVFLLVAFADSAVSWRSKGSGGRWVKNKEPPPKPKNDFEEVECKKCMTQVMRILVPANRGCPGANGTTVASSVSTRASTSFCEPLLPKKRQCIAYSFGVDNVWDFDREMVANGCRVISFDPFCCGAAHRKSENHDFVPIGLSTFDGVMESDNPSKPNITFPVLQLRTIMDSYSHPKVDILRMSVSTMKEWKVLKNLVNTGVLQDIKQLSLKVDMGDSSMWDEYRYVLNGVKTAGHIPYYVMKQPGAYFLKVQEGNSALFSGYEVSYGNVA